MQNSLLYTDLYKLTMQHLVYTLFPRAIARYEFINRDNTPFPAGSAEQLRIELQACSNICLTENEKSFLLKRCKFLPPTYIDFLSGFKLDPSEVGIIQKDGKLEISIEGYWYRTIAWEVRLLAIISNIYYKLSNQIVDLDSPALTEKNQKKASLFKTHNIKFADFGTRRAYSPENHEKVIRDLKDYAGDSLVGTSNTYLAMKYDLKPIGTYAHEFISAVGALKGYKHANAEAMEAWSYVYQGDLGIALTDTFGTNSFLNDFSTKYAKLFDGVRQDSGDPLVFADKIIAHYEKLGIDPLDKTIVFSDGLNPEEVIKIYNYCKGKIKMSFGIGTDLTNSVGVKPLNMVIKLVGINDMPVIKLSDVAGKHTGDKETIELVKKLINY